VNKVLAYCGLLQEEGVSLPAVGVNAAPVEVMTSGALALLWSQVEWPFASSSMQRHAVEFHEVISHVFRQRAVAPFRLLSVFEDRESLSSFLAQHGSDFAADLERLRAFVQMECVAYVARPEFVTDTVSGLRYLQHKAELLHRLEDYTERVKTALAGTSAEIRVREVKQGVRIFALVERGREQEFASIAGDVPVSEGLARRLSGPWPTAEFLSAQVKAPKIAEAM